MKIHAEGFFFLFRSPLAKCLEVSLEVGEMFKKIIISMYEHNTCSLAGMKKQFQNAKKYWVCKNRNSFHLMRAKSRFRLIWSIFFARDSRKLSNFFFVDLHINEVWT